MKPKKNPKADLRRRWVLFLQIGLILTLFLSLQAFQWKNYKPIVKEDPGPETASEITEEIPPVTILPVKTPPPPPPKPMTDKVKEVPNDTHLKETRVVPEEEFEDIPEPEDLETPEEPEEPVEVPYDFVERVLIFPGCERLEDNDERRSCMSAKISKFVYKEFDTGLGAELGLTGTNLVVVMFVVNKNGRVEQIRTRAAHPELEAEARRVISKLPQMQPGRQQGDPVPVSYSIPIRFRVQE